MDNSRIALPRIGVLGGMGPLASAEFLVKLAKATPAKLDRDHFPTTLDSSPQIPDRPSAIDGRGPDPLPAILEVARALEAAGCALIAMPCNTVHHWYDRLVATTSLPIVHIADGVAARLRAAAPRARRVGLLGTTVTSKLGVYSKRLGNEWEWVYPTEDELQTLVMPGAAAVKAGDLVKGRELFLEAVRRLALRDVDAVVLACTEIPVVVGQADSSTLLIDSTEALAEHTIAAAQALHRSRLES